MTENPEEMRARILKIVEAVPFVTELGIELESFGDSWCETRIEPRRLHLQQNGFIHAGVQATLADHSAGMAAITMMPEGKTVLTVEFKINLLRPAPGNQSLQCRSTVLRAGKNLVVCESEVFSAESAQARKLVSKTTVTLAVLEPFADPRSGKKL